MRFKIADEIAKEAWKFPTSNNGSIVCVKDGYVQQSGKRKNTWNYIRKLIDEIRTKEDLASFVSALKSDLDANPDI